MSMGLRYRAGAMGIPFMPSRSMIGSDVGKRVGDSLKTMTCPFTGEEVVLLPALNPDVALIHVQRCDAYGNAQLDGLQFMDIDMAMAANRVILTTERIVSNDQIRRTPDQTRIPFFTVEAVVEAPIGCAPHECYGLYEPFFAHLDDYAERTAKDPVKGRSSISRSTTTGPSPGPTTSPSSAWMPCSMRAAAAGASTMTKHSPGRLRLHRLRAAGRHGRAPAEGRADRVRRRRHPAAGRHAGAAQLRAAPHHPVRGRHHRPLHRAGRAAAVDQRAALHAPLQHGAAHHRRAAAAAARLRRRRLHGRRPDRPLRQPQLLLHRRCRQPQDPPARHRRRQRHLLAHRHDRGHEAREAPLRGRRRLHHLARLDQGQGARAPSAACRRAACGASSPTSPSWASTRTPAR